MGDEINGIMECQGVIVQRQNAALDGFANVLNRLVRGFRLGITAATCSNPNGVDGFVCRNPAQLRRNQKEKGSYTEDTEDHRDWGGHQDSTCLHANEPFSKPNISFACNYPNIRTGLPKLCGPLCSLCNWFGLDAATSWKNLAQKQDSPAWFPRQPSQTRATLGWKTKPRWLFFPRRRMVFQKVRCTPDNLPGQFLAFLKKREVFFSDS